MTVWPPQSSWPHGGGVKAMPSSEPHPAAGEGGASILLRTDGLWLH